MIRALGSAVFASPEQIVEKSVCLAGADRSARVSVAGPDGLAAMIILCRNGFDQVECARQATCSSADEASALLLIAGRMSADELAATLDKTCRLLRDGGALVVQLRRPKDDQTVRAVLQAKGLRVASSVFDLSGGCLVSHTVERAAQLRKTA